MDAGVIGILIAHLEAFGSGELKRECSVSVEECMYQDLGATGLSLNGVNASCP